MNSLGCHGLDGSGLANNIYSIVNSALPVLTRYFVISTVRVQSTTNSWSCSSMRGVVLHSPHQGASSSTQGRRDFSSHLYPAFYFLILYFCLHSSVTSIQEFLSSLCISNPSPGSRGNENNRHELKLSSTKSPHPHLARGT